LEYKFHLPRALPIAPNFRQTKLFGKPFRRSPPNVYGRPDWDLVFLTFFDAGRAVKCKRIKPATGDSNSLESNASLLSTGVGVEFTLKENVVMRLHHGWVLRRIHLPGSDEVRHGSGRLGLSGTILF
jgi:hypothetical protein